PPLPAPSTAIFRKDRKKFDDRRGVAGRSRDAVMLELVFVELDAKPGLGRNDHITVRITERLLNNIILVVNAGDAAFALFFGRGHGYNAAVRHNASRCR